MSLNADCIFCKIIRGEIPSFKVYEDDYVFAFLDIRPYAKAHTIVIPKTHIDYYYDLDEEWYVNLNKSLKIVQQILKDKTGCKRVCQLVEGFEVDHAHIHLIPANSHKDLNELKAQEVSTEELQKVHEMLTK